MPFYFFVWTSSASRKVQEHGLTEQEVEDVISDPVDIVDSDRSRNPIARGYTSTGRWICCVYRIIDEVTIEPVTAFEPHEP
jgi:uncharacterized DUF497 family protein